MHRIHLETSCRMWEELWCFPSCLFVVILLDLLHPLKGVFLSWLLSSCFILKKLPSCSIFVMLPSVCVCATARLTFIVYAVLIAVSKSYLFDDSVDIFWDWVLFLRGESVSAYDLSVKAYTEEVLNQRLYLLISNIDIFFFFIYIFLLIVMIHFLTNDDLQSIKSIKSFKSLKVIRAWKMLDAMKASWAFKALIMI